MSNMSDQERLTVWPVSGTKRNGEPLRGYFARQTTILLLHKFSEFPGTRIVTAKQANGACRQWTQIVVGRNVLLSIRTRAHMVLRAVVAKRADEADIRPRKKCVCPARILSSTLSHTAHVHNALNLCGDLVGIVFASE